MAKNFTRPVDVRDGSYRESVDSIELNWVRRHIACILLPEEVLKKRIRFLARQITADYRDSRSLTIVTILEGAQNFASVLAYLIDHENLEFDSARVSSYRGDRSHGEGRESLPLKNDAAGKDLLVVEDIVDTGRQMRGFLDRVAATLRPARCGWRRSSTNRPAGRSSWPSITPAS